MYPTRKCRRDALFEILDAVLTTPVIESPAHVSLAPGFQRKWGSVSEALHQGTLAPARWEAMGEHPLETEEVVCERRKRVATI